MIKLLFWVAVGIGAAITAWRAASFRRRMEDVSTSWRCVACESTDLESVADGVYRCRQCEYEGGPGLAAFAAAKAEAAYAAVDPTERRAIANRHLQDAKRVLSALSESPNGPSEVLAWLASVDETAMRGAEELELAARAAGGPVEIAGRGFVDPRELAQALRQRAAVAETPFDDADLPRARETCAVIRTVVNQLDTMLSPE